MAEGPAVAAANDTYGDEVTFLGIGGLAELADFEQFVERTGTGGFTHLSDESGELWERFGTEGRSTFLFVDDDGTIVRTSYGIVDEDRLAAEIDRLVTS